jgi:hypothetical protein
MRLKHQARWSRPTRCRTAQTQRQRSASARRQRVRMESPERSIRQIHLPPSIGGSTRSRNSASRQKDRASSPVPAAANTPRRQRGCAAPCCSPAQTAFCELTSLGSLSCGAVANPGAIARGGGLVHSRLERRPADIAKLGVPLSKTNRYLIHIGDERTAKSEHIRRARQALFQCSL